MRRFNRRVAERVKKKKKRRGREWENEYMRT
jgi:hypothetical protein